MTYAVLANFGFVAKFMGDGGFSTVNINLNPLTFLVVLKQLALLTSNLSKQLILQGGPSATLSMFWWCP